MTKVTAQMSISLDGFYTGPRGDGDPQDMRSWMDGPEAPGFFRVTRWAVDAMAWRERQGFAGGERGTDSTVIEESFAAAGAYVMGRRMFDAGEVPWGDDPPFRAPVFVVTHRPRETLQRQGGTSFTFVSDVEEAVERARTAAGDKDVAVSGGGTLLRQVLRAGLLDEIELHTTPVLLGDGQRLFEPADLDLAPDQGLELVPTRVIEGEAVTHVRYRVAGRSQLVLDDRGRTEPIEKP
jgi:dihydrofolate reductase